MSDNVQQIFKFASSHITVALITALITASFAIGSYRTKFDALMLQNDRLSASFEKLSVDLNDLRVEVAGLRGEMRQSRTK